MPLTAVCDNPLILYFTHAEIGIIMDRLEILRIFVAVADHRSFAEAARKLRVSPTATSRAIAALEQSLGTALFYRTTRSVRLTEDGAAYLERCRTALTELDDAALALRGQDAAPRGLLVITAPVMFGRLHILPIITRLLRDNPMLNVQLTLADRVVRVVDEGIDVAVRIGDLPDSSLNAIKISEVQRLLVASPNYMAAHGVPDNIAALRHHNLISFIGLDLAQTWRFGADDAVVRIAPRLTLNSAEAAIAAAIAGAGIARILSYQALDAIAAGQLITIFDDLAPPPVPVHLVFQAHRRSTVNVRAFIDAARAYFAQRDLVSGA